MIFIDTGGKRVDFTGATSEQSRPAQRIGLIVTSVPSAGFVPFSIVLQRTDQFYRNHVFIVVRAWRILNRYVTNLLNHFVSVAAENLV